MGAAFFRFYAELNDFLPPDKRQIEFIHSFEHRVSIEDMIESLGVPHTEVDLILVGGEPVDFSYTMNSSSAGPAIASTGKAPITIAWRSSSTKSCRRSALFHAAVFL